VWLFHLSFGLFGKRALWLGFILVLVALAAWIFGEFVQRGRRRKGLAAGLVLALVAGGFGMTWRQLHAREVVWQPWSAQAVAKARAQGRPVLVDFTADWCVTCITLVKPALESASVRKRLGELNAVSLLADYTFTPPEMTEELQRFGRAGVPMVLLYPADSSKPPVVLPDALTAGMVLDALNRAAQSK
jgi:thiol:disulfide interchange protein